MDLRKYLCTGTPNLPEATLEGVLQQPTLNQSYPTPLSTPFIDPRKVENYCWHNPQVLQSTAKRWKSSETGPLHPNTLDFLLGQLICAAYNFNAAKITANSWEMKNESHKRLEAASWKAEALTSFGLWCWNGSAALRVRANEALGCVSMNLMVFLRPLLKYWTTFVMSTLEMLKT